jgi:hypothetical protein
VRGKLSSVSFIGNEKPEKVKKDIIGFSRDGIDH